MKNSLLVISLAAMSATAGAVTPLWLRDVKISPDGSKIAFTYKGDIFTVPAAGGTATRLTTDAAYETSPIWSPDGTMIAYASDRHGSADLFIIPAGGGEPRRLTSFSSAETPQSFSPDGKLIYFSAAIQDPASSALFPSGRLTELYSVETSGGGVKQVLPTPAERIAFAPDGKSFVYQDVKGVENEWRKHHTSSVTRGLWRYDLKTGKHTPLVDHPGEDRDPIISPSGTELIFLSERNGGSMNVYSLPLNNLASQPTALTSLTEHPVRFLSQAADGTLAMAYDGEIFTLTPGSTPQKVSIDITTDAYEAPDFQNFSSGAQEVIPSPDGELIAYTRRGDIFVSSVEFGTTKQITSTPWKESSPSWADGGRTLYFVSNRDGRNDIYRAEMTRSADPNMLYSTMLKEERVLPKSGDTERADALVSPDGTKIAFVQNRSELMVMDLTSKKVTKLAGAELNAERTGVQYTWSPDSKWILFTCVPHHHSPYYDIALVNADGNTPEITYVTETGYFEEMPRFSPDGTAITWLSERYGMRNHASWGTQYDVMAAFLTQEALDRYNLSSEELAAAKAAEKKAQKDDKDKKDSESESKDLKIEREGLEDRIVRLTPYSSNIADAILSKDGEKLYYLSKVEKGMDLWKIDLRKGGASIVNKLGMGGSARFEPNGNNLFILTPSPMKKLDFGNEKFTNVSISGRQKIDRIAEMDAMLEFVRTEEKEKFYTPGMHGVKWDELVDHYRRFLPHINNYGDFSEMLSELLGELNVSHTGSGYRPNRGADEQTADLGVIYDLTYAGPGLKIAEIVKGSPLDRADSQLRKGDVITSINGTKLTADTDFTSLLNGLSGKLILIEANSASGGKVEQTVKPISRGTMQDLLYKRWVKRNAEKVDSLSGGRLGYVHIQSMSDPSFRPMYAQVLGKYNDRDGIIIDTRWNGGGRMHEDIEVLFSGKQYLTQKVRGVETARMPSRRWNKPSIMLIGEANYSNAHGTPWVYSKMGLGKLVGMPVPGTMTSVNWVDLQEPSVYFGIPVIGYETAEGTYLENSQLDPDIRVANTPERAAAGIDDQLETAVKTLLNDIDSQIK
ncbi:MAG: PDZ domain-containing protein [Muribaculaceae bacterium]|nr:PDZ domain-containing protein [Muribaculaceae bacterium]